ncbi:MAG: class I SAM-dependent methyltransferase [Verrucomicrobia bacterium]|nr:class I SAM-dependent methyltransferase [Verrucomicrobiota bacterium]
MIRERNHCRACGSNNLALVLDLGKTALANDFLLPEESGQYSVFLPLRLCVCQDCSLAQLADTVDPEVLYSHYAYVTSTSRTMDAHLTEQCHHLLSQLHLSRPARVLEIASNTGIYLKKFQQQDCEVLGVEPARNIGALAVADGVPTRAEFFNARTARNIREEWGAADLILGRHVFAHIDDLRDLLAGLETVAQPGALIAFEVPYLVDFFKGVQFDTIYHEHLSYVSVRSLEALLQTTPFRLQRVDDYPIHGGSILFQFRFRNAEAPVHSSVPEALQTEAQMQLANPKSWAPFVQQVRHIQTELPALVRRLKGQGRRVIGYGASAKGNTLLNTCGLTVRDLDYIIDNTPFKQNKVAPGSWIPIRPPEWLLKDRPDYSLILAWNFAREIMSREEEYQQAGGKFILPIPEPKIME